jgi:hypothetical protein
LLQSIKSAIPRLGLFVLLLHAAAVQAQTLAHFGNFAPRQGETGGALTLLVNDAAVARDVVYASLLQGLSLPAGVVTLTLLDEGANVLAQREARLLRDVTYTIYAAGNGRERDFELRVVRESAQPLRAGRYALQLYSAALHPQDPLRFTLACGLVHASGTLTFGREDIGRGEIVSDGFGCDFRVETDPPAAAPVASARFATLDGGLQRLVLVGDGDTQPWQLLVIDGIEQARALVVPDARMDGLWFDPSDSGSGLTVLVESGEDGEPRVTGVLYGYDLDGDPTWALIEGAANRAADIATLEGMRVLESVGGTAQGDRQPVRMRLGIASLDFHSCREATLFLFATSERMPQRLGRELGDGAQQLFRLQRLLPIDECLTGGAAGPTSSPLRGDLR